MIIGLCGKMGSGKDAVAALLTMRGFQRLAFADALRREVEKEIAGGHFDDQLDAGDLCAERGKLIAEVWAKPTTPRMRTILQNFGMIRREQVPGYWVKKVRRNAARFPYAVISDVRFADEAAICDQVWRVERPGAGGGTGSEHVSEMIPFHADRVIVNDGTLERLARRVCDGLNELTAAA